MTIDFRFEVYNFGIEVVVARLLPSQGVQLSHITSYLHIWGPERQLRGLFLLMYVNGKQLGELKHGVGSLGKSASRPFRPNAIC